MNYLTKQLYNRQKRKAVSPVISTIIIVAIAIAISIAVALYLTGITGQFTRFERLDVTSAYANPLVGTTSNVELNLKNSGTSVLTIDRVLLNGRPVNLSQDSLSTNATTWNGARVNITGTPAITMSQGDSGTLILPIKGTSGLSMELTLHTVSGKEYPKVVVLP